VRIVFRILKSEVPFSVSIFNVFRQQISAIKGQARNDPERRKPECTKCFKEKKKYFHLKATVQTTVQSTGNCTKVFIRGYPAAERPER
jgi:hypothetical protein